MKGRPHQREMILYVCCRIALDRELGHQRCKLIDIAVGVGDPLINLSQPDFGLPGDLHGSLDSGKTSVLGTCSLLLDHNEAQSITICDGVLLGVGLSTIAAFMQRVLAREGVMLLSGHADHADEAALRG
jgi:hypothetical protein